MYAIRSYYATRLASRGEQESLLLLQPERALNGAIDAPTQPVPDISLVDCPDREAWGALLWELNQPGSAATVNPALTIAANARNNFV